MRIDGMKRWSGLSALYHKKASKKGPTFSGTKYSSIVAPPFGTIRRSPAATGGYNRNVSSITAAKYGSFEVLLMVIS